ncbi:MAG TPA: FtsX-like permease family protein [Terriglobales bacterium]|nr:FtsX-like permease family protein [Terriglobales bacterium]
MLLLTIFAAVAMLLAASELYGVMSYSVAQRTHEIGIRMALGARRPDVLVLVAKQGMALALMGIAAGAILSLGMTRLISGMLWNYGNRPSDFRRRCRTARDCGVSRELPASSPRFEGRSRGGVAIRVDVHKCLSKICMQPRRTMPKKFSTWYFQRMTNRRK